MQPVETDNKLSLVERCFESLFKLEQKEVLSPELEALYERIVECGKPEDWDESNFDNEEYRQLLVRLQRLEEGRNKLYDIRYKLEQLRPAKSAVLDYI
ncbi:MAG: hypothetical protein EP343_22265 [Deltaproteobacteria bacterium]|nr:MAG: hypothetical protein EP343_22265 [Deltaproteobacteria bacterium]